MALLEIPLSNANPSFVFRVELETQTYEFRFRWNGRMESWIMDLFDANGTVIQIGYPFVVSYLLFRQVVSTVKYPGELQGFNTEEIRVNPTRFNLGGDVKLSYEESVE